jgi:hypothetical protein
METSNAFKNLSLMVKMMDYLVQLQTDRDMWQSNFRSFYADVSEQINFENWERLKLDVVEYGKLLNNKDGE